MNRRGLLLYLFIYALIVLAMVGCSQSQTTINAIPPTPPIRATDISSSSPTSTTTAVSTPTYPPSLVIPIRVLFIGNSLTFTNDLPVVLSGLAASGSFQIETDMVAHGGWTLADHAASQATLDEVEHGEWDYVILQEQSTLPAIKEQREERMYPAVRLLDQRIRESGANTIMFMTWGHRDGLPTSGYENFTTLQGELKEGYTQIAHELGVMVAPVGTAWVNVITQNHQLVLWQSDGIHPTREGTYLAANIFYTLLFQQSPGGLEYSAGLPEETALFLQKMAAETVLGNLK